MNELDEIYEVLSDLGICETQAEFSTVWLGKTAGYYAYLKSSGSSPCLSAIGMLIGRLQSICPTTDDSRYWEERRRIRHAICAAKTMWLGEFELANVPAWCRITAI